MTKSLAHRSSHTARCSKAPHKSMFRYRRQMRKSFGVFGDLLPVIAPAHFPDTVLRACAGNISVKDQTLPPFAGPVSSGARQRMTRPAEAIIQPQPWGSVKVTLSVSERFRGTAGDTLVVRTEVGTAACGYPFEVGHSNSASCTRFSRSSGIWSRT